MVAAKDLPEFVYNLTSSLEINWQKDLEAYMKGLHLLRTRQIDLLDSICKTYKLKLSIPLTDGLFDWE